MSPIGLDQEIRDLTARLFRIESVGSFTRGAPPESPTLREAPALTIPAAPGKPRRPWPWGKSCCSDSHSAIQLGQKRDHHRSRAGICWW